MGVELILGDALEVVRGLPDESFTACFCDPPYGLKFMSKKWDHGVPSKEVWAEVLRVLKPGAILMAFGGTRTWHRLAVAIEDAGFEIFDTMLWLYGSGFPKSHNIGKAIDKAGGAEREVIRSGVGYEAAPDGNTYGHGLNAGFQPRELTAPATDAAKTWEGYGTALKPAWEPILLARKPRSATYAQTAMEHGTGALNVDGCRIGTNDNLNGGGYDPDGRSQKDLQAASSYATKPMRKEFIQPSGRWPANLLLSHLPDCERVGVKRVKGTTGIRGSDAGNTMYGGGKGLQRPTTGQEVGYADPDGLETVAAYRCSPNCPVAMLDRQSGVRPPGKGGTMRAGYQNAYVGGKAPNVIDCPGYSDTGGASRFFQTFEGERFLYQSKASRKERDMGLEEIIAQNPTGTWTSGIRICKDCGRTHPTTHQGNCLRCGSEHIEWAPETGVGRTRKKPRNFHPTVKPLALCEYLARLIVPPEEYRDGAQLLVPFMGTASEIIGALKAGWRNVTGIDIVPEYLEIARLRIAAYMKDPKQMTLGGD